MLPAAPPPQPPLAPPAPSSAVWPEIVSNILLFILVFSFAAAVDYGSGLRKGYLLRGVAMAMLLQFVLLPFLGFCMARAFALDHVYGIMLQVITSSPGGAYSNWWCSLMNADLIMSVSSTAVGTVLSAGLLPLNLVIYLRASYDVNALAGLRWDALLITIGVVTSAVLCGGGASFVGARKPWYERTRSRSQLLGNLAGAALIIFSFCFSAVREPIWNREGSFYAAFGLPPLLTLCLATLLASAPCLRLTRPVRVAVTVECAYQNVGIGLGVALSLFAADELGRAAGCPIYYGVVQTASIPIYLTCCWKAGWTYAPPSDNILNVLRKSYQPTGQSAAVGVQAPELQISLGPGLHGVEAVGEQRGSESLSHLHHGSL